MFAIEYPFIDRSGANRPYLRLSISPESTYLNVTRTYTVHLKSAFLRYLWTFLSAGKTRTRKLNITIMRSVNITKKPSYSTKGI